jgi:hypothetical protein
MKLAFEKGKTDKREQIRKSIAEKVHKKNQIHGAYLGVSKDLIYDPNKEYQDGQKVFHNGFIRVIDNGKVSKFKSDEEKFVSATKQQGKKKGLLGIEKLLGDWQSNLESLDSMIDKMMFREKGAKMFSTTMHKILSHPLRKASTAEKTANLRDKNSIKQAALAIFGKKWRRELKKNAIPKEVELTLANGKTAKNKDGSLPMYSKNDLYYIWMSWQQKDVRPSIEAIGFDANTIKEVEGMLDESTKRWAMWQRDVFYKNKGQELSKVYEEAYGIPLDLVENYFPVEKSTEASEALQVASTGSTGFMNPSEVVNHFKERRDKSAPLKVVDGDALLFRYMLKTNHFSAFFDSARTFRSVLSDRSFRNAIESDFGDRATKILDKFARDITVGGTQYDDAVKLIETIRRNMVLSTLGANLTMIPKQLSSFVAYAAHMPAGAWVKGEAKFWMNPVKNSKEILSLPFIQERIDSGYERDMLELMSSKKVKELGGKGTRRGFINTMMIPTKFGDVGAIVTGGWPLYKYYTAKYGQEEGYRRFVEATSNTQQSGDLMDLSTLQRGNGWEKLFTTYMTTPMQYFRLGSAAMRRMIQGRGSAKENVKVATMYFVVLPALFSAVSGNIVGLLSGDEDEAEESIFNIGTDVLAQLIGNGIPIWNTIINNLIGHVQGNRYPMRLSPLTTVLEEASKAGKTGYDWAFKDQDMDAFVEFTKQLGYVSAIGAGVPIKPLGRTAGNIYSIVTGEDLVPEKKTKSKSNASRSASRKMRTRQSRSR